MKRKYLLFFLFINMICYGQENCYNGIDDNSNGLIDLNDSDCDCIQSTVTSIIPNPSFEMYSLLPDYFSQLYNAISWQEATIATTDYLHALGFMFPGMDSLLLPFPDGNAIVGSIYYADYKEYLGATLLNPMIAGRDYQLTFNIAALALYEGYNISLTSDINSTFPDLTPINITLYGKNGNANFPLHTLIEPIFFGSSWIVLGEATYDPVSNWGELTINFTPTIDINAIILGPPVNMPEEYPFSSPPPFTSPYFVYDNLILNEALLFGAHINYTGNFCDNNLELNALPDNPNLNYQWYLNGIAIPNATNPQYIVGYSDENIGEYKVRIYNDEECRNSEGFFAFYTEECLNEIDTNILVFNEIRIPDAFTPNNDNVNDVFYILGGPFEHFLLRIYNRWGEVLFETNNSITGWDGTYKGVLQKADIYFYFFKGEFDGNTSLRNGAVTLIR